MAYDAVLRNLAVIGEAVRALPNQVKASRPDLPWVSIAGLRNVVVHVYFRVDPGLIRDIVDNELDALANAIRDQMSGDGPGYGWRARRERSNQELLGMAYRLKPGSGPSVIRPVPMIVPAICVGASAVHTAITVTASPAISSQRPVPT